MIGLLVSGGSRNKGELIKKYYSISDFKIGIDKGVEYLVDLELEFDLAIGDFDSISTKYLEYLNRNNIKKIILNVEKDDTDTEAGINFLIEKNCDEIYILSGTGTRLDHTLANIFLLKKIENAGITGYIIDDNNRVRLSKIENKIVNKYENISIIPISRNGINVTLDGFYYELNDDEIEYGSSRCVSNYLVKDTGTVYINRGKALIIESRD